MLIGCERGIAFEVLFCGNDAGLIARRTLDGNGTGFGSEIFKLLGRVCVSVVVHVGEARVALSGDCCTFIGCIRLFWLQQIKQQKSLKFSREKKKKNMEIVKVLLTFVHSLISLNRLVN